MAWRAFKRRTEQREKEMEDLLVFGYQCTLFRDDHRAAEQERGVHLIPCNDDNSLQIDRKKTKALLSSAQNERKHRCTTLTDRRMSFRYDCRLHLSSVRPFDADFVEKDHQLRTEERAEEELCEEERYKALDEANEREEALKEEERKRKSIGGAEFHFSYDEGTNVEESKSDESSGDDEPFEAPVELRVPVGVTTPSTVKQNAIIEKTALFVTQQGPQMEILIKARQGSSEQFKFLDWGDTMNAYYKHVLKMMKDHKYVPQIRHPKAAADDSDSDSDGDYLHPSLLGGASASNGRNTPNTSVPAVQYKLGHENDVYSALFKKLAAIIPHVKQRQDAAAEAIEEAKSITIPEQNVPVSEETPNAKSPITLPPVASAPQLSEPPKGPPPSDYAEWHQWFYGAPPHSSVQPNVIPPPPDLMPVVNKTAEFVVKFGTAAEDHLRRRPELHLDFLIPTHPYYAYYQMRIRWLQYDNYCKTNPTACYSMPQSSSTYASEGRSVVAGFGEESADRSKVTPRKRRFFHDGPLEPEDKDEKKVPFVGPISFAIKEKRSDSVPSMNASTPSAPSSLDTNTDGSGKPVFYIGPHGSQMFDEHERASEELSSTDEQLQSERKRKARAFLERLQERLASKQTQNPEPEASVPKSPSPVPVPEVPVVHGPQPKDRETGELSDDSSASSDDSSDRKRSRRSRDLPSAYAQTRNRRPRSREKHYSRHSRSHRHSRRRTRSRS